MATILTFQSRESASSTQDFLTDETEKLSFRTAEDGAVSLGDVTPASLPGVLLDPKKDWSNQELADLFRVHQLLSNANVPVETMRGVTDEGDPWFIFCHFSGDVFIHMARINGEYVLDSPNVHRPLRGHDFNALIADYTNHALPASQPGGAEATTERRVIRFERGSKVRLHPSAMLAALIWTLFLASEELVMLAPDEQADAGDDLMDFSNMISADADFQSIVANTAESAELDLPETLKTVDTDAAHNSNEVHLHMRDALGQQGMAMQQNTFAMGLSTIAIAMGFMSEAVLLDNQREVLDGLRSIGLAQYDSTGTTDAGVDQFAADEANPLLDMLARFLGIDLSENTEVAEADSAADNSSVLQDILHATDTTAHAQALLAASEADQTILREDENSDLSEAPEKITDTPNDAEAFLVAQTTEQQDADVVNMLDIGNRLHQLEEFQLGKTTVMASFDLTGSDATYLTNFIFPAQRTTNHREFDEQAQSFIDYIQAKDTEVGIITIGNEVIMIDRGAFDASGADTYAFSWETYGGQVISMIGLKSEFQQFDLIA